jgi:hypothetical protein
MMAIPLWVLIGVAVVFVFQEGTIGESHRLAFVIAAVTEAILARYAFHTLWPTFSWRKVAMRFQSISEAVTSNEDSVARLERMSGRRIASIEDLLRFVARSSEIKQENRPVRVQVVQRSIFRQTASFAALVIAFLHYYFWDVSLQIASLRSVTVFVTVTPPLSLQAG